MWSCWSVDVPIQLSGVCVFVCVCVCLCVVFFMQPAPYIIWKDRAHCWKASSCCWSSWSLCALAFRKSHCWQSPTVHQTSRLCDAKPHTTTELLSRLSWNKMFFYFNPKPCADDSLYKNKKSPGLIPVSPQCLTRGASARCQPWRGFTLYDLLVTLCANHYKEALVQINTS